MLHNHCPSVIDKRGKYFQRVGAKFGPFRPSLAVSLAHRHDEPRRRLLGLLTRRVFALGAAGYVLLALGLGNAIFLFSLAQPWLVVRAIAVALAVGLGVGITLSRTYDYWWSAAGMTTTGFVFASLTGLATWRTLRRADLHLYSAY